MFLELDSTARFDENQLTEAFRTEEPFSVPVIYTNEEGGATISGTIDIVVTGLSWRDSKIHGKVLDVEVLVMQHDFGKAFPSDFNTSAPFAAEGMLVIATGAFSLSLYSPRDQSEVRIEKIALESLRAMLASLSTEASLISRTFVDGIEASTELTRAGLELATDNVRMRLSKSRENWTVVISHLKLPPTRL
jgi:hypothetical protein